MAWARLVDDASGKPYYYNEETGVTQWEFPEDVLETALAECGWSKAKSEDSQVYFYSQETEESSWSLPDIVVNTIKNFFDEDSREGITADEIVASISLDTADETDDIVVDDTTNQIENVQTVLNVNELINLNEILENYANNLRKNETTSEKGVEEDSVEHGESTIDKTDEEEFLNLLKDSQIQLSWNYKDLLENSSCMEDDRYWKITDPFSREKLFIKYINKIIEEEYEKGKDKYRKSFFEILKKHNVKYYTRWRSCEKLIWEEELYQKLSDKVKEEFFNEYIRLLREEKEKVTSELKKQESELLEDELSKTLDLTSEFTTVVGTIENDKKYNNLNKGDIIEVFEKIMEIKEKEEQELIDIEKKKNYMYDKQTRDAFKNKLNELIESGEFKPNSQTKWIDFISVFKETKEFEELFGHNGSSPIDYYWDMIYNENLKVSKEVETAKRMLVNSNIRIDQMNLNSFIEFMRSRSKLVEEDLKTLYDLVVSNVAVKRTYAEVNEYVSLTSDKRSKRY